jgi:hypothetical protein
MRQPPDKPRGRPGQETAPQDDARGDGTKASIIRCPLIRAARATGEPAVVSAVLHYHPPARCPARREAA